MPTVNSSPSAIDSTQQRRQQAVREQCAEATATMSPGLGHALKDAVQSRRSRRCIVVRGGRRRRPLHGARMEVAPEFLIGRRRPPEGRGRAKTSRRAGKEGSRSRRTRPPYVNTLPHAINLCGALFFTAVSALFWLRLTLASEVTASRHQNTASLESSFRDDFVSCSLIGLRRHRLDAAQGLGSVANAAQWRPMFYSSRSSHG